MSTNKAAFCVAILFLSTFTHAALTSMRAPLFGPADKARSAADAQQAKLLAPTTYIDAQNSYDRAESTFKRAGNIDTIRRHLGKAQAKYLKAAERAEIAAAALDVAIQARSDAFASEATEYAADSWYDGEENFAESTRRLEHGSIKSAQRYATKATKYYRESELLAIKANYLSETKSLIKQAEKLSAKRHSPMSLNNARILLDTAETELTTNRYDTDRPRLLALEAKHNALHAIYISKLKRSIRDGSTNLEEILMGWESSISKVGDLINKPLYFDEGEGAAIEQLLQGVSELQRNNQNLVQDLRDNQAQVAALNGQITKMQTMMAEVNSLQQEKQNLDESLGDREAQVMMLNEQLARMHSLLGGGNQTIEELETLLEQQARHRERFAQIENIFPTHEAVVFRQGDTVIIRMIGLNFDSGDAQLKSEHTNMLSTLQQAIAVFPDSHVTVEGHTDAFGSDEENLNLSQARAKSVVQHLLSASAVSSGNLNSMGYGESRPVANNETEEGRKRNRRIDLVIQPSWVREGSLVQTDVAQALDI